MPFLPSFSYSESPSALLDGSPARIPPTRYTFLVCVGNRSVRKSPFVVHFLRTQIVMSFRVAMWTAFARMNPINVGGEMAQPPHCYGMRWTFIIKC